MNSHNKTDSIAPGSSAQSASRPVPGRSSINIRVRYCECDPMGVAHHASYLPWLEMGRTELLRNAGETYKSLESAGVFLVIIKVEVRYRRPIRYDDVIEVRTLVAGGSKVKIRHEYKIILVERDGKKLETLADPSVLANGVLAVASTELACVDANGKVQPLPDWLQQT